MAFLLFCPFKNCIFQIYTFWNSTYTHQIAANSEGAGLWWGGAENSYSSHLSGLSLNPLIWQTIVIFYLKRSFLLKPGNERWAGHPKYQLVRIALPDSCSLRSCTWQLISSASQCHVQLHETILFSPSSPNCLKTVFLLFWGTESEIGAWFSQLTAVFSSLWMAKLKHVVIKCCNRE